MRISPSPALAPYVRHYVVAQSESASEYRVYPDTGLVMGFQWRGGVARLDSGHVERLSPAGVTGLSSCARVFASEAGTLSVLVYFTDGGAWSFFSDAVADLRDGSVALRDILPGLGTDSLPERLHAAPSHRERVGMVEALLLRILRGTGPDRRILMAARHIRLAGGDIRIADLAREVSMSERDFERRFLAVIGTTAKSYAGVARWRAGARALAMSGDQSRVAIGAGYFDQAHLVRDFTRRAGVPPGRFLREGRDIGGFLQDFPEESDTI